MMYEGDNYWAEHKRFYKLAKIAGFAGTIEALWNWIAGGGSTPTSGNNSYFPSGW